MINKINRTVKLIVAAVLLMIFSSVKAYAVDTILKVAFDPNMPPYQFMDNGKPAGMHIDIMDKLAERYIFKIEYVPVENTSNCLEALEDGKYDIVLGVVSGNGKYKVDLTDDISQSSICTFVNNNKMDNVKNKDSSLITTFEDGTIGYSFIHNIDNLKTIVVSNQVRAFDLLVSKRADMLLGVKSSILYQLEKANLEKVYHSK